MNSINWILGLVSILSTLMIVFGSIGYFWNVYKTNLKKKKKFKEMVFCGIIIFIIAMITYAMVIVPSVNYIY